jgi:hypothetical protein
MAKKPTSKQTERALDLLAAHFASGRAAKRHQPSTDAIRRLGALPLLFEENATKSTKSGRVQFDSWAEGGVALRDATAGHVRRVRLASGSVGLDLVAERGTGGWQFTARAYHDGNVSHDYILKVGGAKLSPRSGGYFQWRTRGVPRQLELNSQNNRITFEQIAW